jgi:hypothetical protein
LLQCRMDVGQFLVQPGDLCLEFGDKVVRGGSGNSDRPISGVSA